MHQREHGVSARNPWAAAWCFFVVMSSVTITTPLWGYYEVRYDFGSTGVSIAFGAMALGVFVALPLFGGLSDSWGRFKVMTLAIIVSLLAVGILLLPGVAALLVARVMQGFAVALTVSSVPPAISEGLARGGEARTALAAAVSTLANLGGLGMGSMLSAAVVRTVGHPFSAPYISIAVLLCTALVPCGRGAAEDRAWSGFAVRLPRVPDGGLMRYVGAGVSALAAFAAFSVYASLGPGVLADVFSVRTPIAGPALYCAVMAFSAVGQLTVLHICTGWRQWIGIALFIGGFGVVTAAVIRVILPEFVVGGIVLGLGSGILFAEALRSVTSSSHPDTAAASQAGFFMMAYVGMIVPIIALASLIRLLGTPAAFGLTGVILSLLAILGAVASRPRRYQGGDIGV
ncbi:MAG: MFS transporter [Bifidobacterium psychraerophilum]